MDSSQQPPQYSLPPRPSFWRRNASNLVVLALLVGLVAVQWPMLKGLFYRATGAPAPAGLIAWRTDLDAALAEAKEAGKPVLVDFTASWCPPCQAMKHDVWPDPEVGRLAMAHYVPVLVDVDAAPAVAQRYDIESIPTVLILDAQGKVLHQGSFMSRSEMVEFLNANAG